MEFHSKLLQPLPKQNERGENMPLRLNERGENKPLHLNERGWKGPLPFYMTYPDYYGPGREVQLLQDLEYLQQLYPNDVKRYQRRISEILDKTDYEGSMIYDEYPDKYSLLALAGSMRKVLEIEEEKAPEESMIQVLLFNEVYKRRHGGRRGSFFF